MSPPGAIVIMKRSVGRSRDGAATRRGRPSRDTTTAPMRRIRMQLNIVAYAADCRVLGRLELEADRISDLLNDAQTYELSDAVFESLEDGHRVEMPEFTIA